MSAWLLGPEHIDLILTEAIKSEHISQYEDVNVIGQMLLDENRKSIDSRYQESNDHVAYQFVPFPLSYNRFDVDMAARSYRYQSCEHDGWLFSEANAWIETFIKANKERFSEDDTQAMHDDDSSGWFVHVDVEWEEGVRLPDYRTGAVSHE